MKETKLIETIKNFIQLCDHLLLDGIITAKQHWKLTNSRKTFLESFR
ncbi:hypothetical protein [Geosporobacter ferrireducens]|nr:hypothetical protein [Geosporobacter ferrireducens]